MFKLNNANNTPPPSRKYAMCPDSESEENGGNPIYSNENNTTSEVNQCQKLPRTNPKFKQEQCQKIDVNIEPLKFPKLEVGAIVEFNNRKFEVCKGDMGSVVKEVNFFTRVGRFFKNGWGTKRDADVEKLNAYLTHSSFKSYHVQAENKLFHEAAIVNGKYKRPAALKGQKNSHSYFVNRRNPDTNKKESTLIYFDLDAISFLRREKNDNKSKIIIKTINNFDSKEILKMLEKEGLEVNYYQDPQDSENTQRQNLAPIAKNLGYFSKKRIGVIIPI